MTKDKNQSGKKYDVVIVGGGPAGSTCALRLKNSGLKIALLEKHIFPRNKVCGDCIPGKALFVLQSVSSKHYEKFLEYPKKSLITKTKFYINNTSNFEVKWINKSYLCKREDFDLFLLEAAKQESKLDVVQDFRVDFIQKNESSITVGNTKKNVFFNTSMLIGCDGAQSVVSRRLTNNKISYKDHAAAVRGYFSNMEEIEPQTNEVYTQKEFLPGYFWVFPSSRDTANVGFGILSDCISKNKINLRKSLYDFINSLPVLAKKFKNSHLIGKLEGSGLPLGSRRIQVVGDRFILTGDAASLVDPTSGDGINHAMLSGKLAAEQIIQSFNENNFSADFLHDYAYRLFKLIGKELKRKTFMLRLGTKAPKSLGFVSYFLTNNTIKKHLKKVFF